MSPQPGIPTRESGHSPDRGIDEHPLFAVRDEAQPDVHGTTQIDHSLGRGGHPAITFERPIERCIRPVLANEHQRPFRPLIVNDGVVGTKRHAVLRDFAANRVR